MSHIQVSDAQAWLEGTKANLGPNLDTNLEDLIASEVISTVAQSYDVSGWTDYTKTPKLVRKVIGMKYAAAYYNRQYSEDAGTNDYAVMLDGNAELLMEGIVIGANVLTDATVPYAEQHGPEYWPNNASVETDQFGNVLNDGQPMTPAFTMGRVF